MKKVISVRFKDNGKTYYFDPADTPIQTGDYVIVETARGVECGEVVQGVKEIADSAVPKALKPITRMADSVDVRRMRQNREDEKRAYRTCQECIARHGLEMKLVEAEYTLDRSKIMFYFTADGRVDFRELVKDLAGIFHTRIELRQIGVRDESKMIGGLGLRRPPFCCSRFLKDFQPVSIKMAKEQGLSLNPTKISGACGRLMCCLAYEENAYEYLNSIMPMVGSTVRTPDGLGTVLEVNPISGYLRVRCGTEAFAPRYYKVSVCEYVSGGTNLSMANEAFSHPCTLAVANGIGVVRLHPVDLSARSQMTGREMNGRVRRLMYLDGSTFALAYDDGRAISFPARTLHFLNIGSGVGQILHGSVCLRMQCSVGTKHMPESTAIFTILI